MIAIFKRDYRAYFTSPIGYVFCAIFLCLFNLFFYLINVASNSADMSGTFSSMLMFTMFLVPVLTMRTFSEDFKQKTDQLLLTSPVKLVDIVLGKFFASFGVFLTAMVFTLVYSVIIAAFGEPMPGVVIGNYFAYIALTAAWFAIGLFISSLTESQIVAGVISWGVFLAMFLMESLASSITVSWLYTIISWLSVFTRYGTFLGGVFALKDFIFFLSLCTVFLFLTTRVLEKKRWG